MGAGVVCALGFVSGCSPSSKVSRESEFAVIVVETRTSVGEPVPGGQAEALFPVGEQTRDDVQVTQDEAQGETTLTVPQGGGVRVVAKCPAGTEGVVIDRRLTPGQLADNRTWRFSQVCEPQEFVVGIAVLAPSCGEVAVSLDDQELGETKGGVFHHLLQRAVRGRARLSARPLSDQCFLAQAEFSLEFSNTRSLYPVRLTALAPTSGQSRGRKGKKRWGGKSSLAPRGPYRL
jgi:hypothetical protein